MPKSCLVCNIKFEKGSVRSFHRFPKNADKKKSWCEVLGISKNIPFYEVLCSDHFSPESIKTLPGGKRSLVDRAIPIAVTVLQPINIERNTSPIDSVSDESEKEDYIPLECVLEKQTKRPIEEGSPILISSNDSHESSSTITASETERECRRLHARKTLKLKKKMDRSSVYRRKWRAAQKTVINQKVVISSQKRQISHLKSRLATYRKTLIHLKKNNFLRTSVEAIIDVYRMYKRKNVMAK